LYSSI
jgi:intermediate peptidase